MWSVKTVAHDGSDSRDWSVYKCNNCGGAVLAAAHHGIQNVSEIYPSNIIVEDAIPSRAKSYLQQAIDSLHSPAGAVMLTASAVDSMLKEKSYTDGSLYDRINKAATEHVITQDMALWAHQVRLDANDQRHSDENVELPTRDEAQRSIDFAQALAQFLFVLPTQVTRGLTESK
jgi:hypothetical protein